MCFYYRKAVLEKWKYEFGNNATYNNLICALEGTGCQWYANIVKRIHSKLIIIGTLIVTIYCKYALCTVYITDSNTEHVYQSIHFYKAKNIAQVPFLFHKIIDVNHKGLEYTTEDHDITIRIPEGAVPKGRTFHFEIGVTTYGPFNFPEGTRPISPIVWVCIMEENVINFHQLKKKFQLILPHFLRGLNKERLRCHQVHAAKANHNDINQTMYKFNLLECQPLFASPNEYKSYGLIESNHCCFYCLQANQSPELAKDTSYYLVRIESSMSSEIYFVAGFFLNTCIQVRVS